MILQIDTQEWILLQDTIAGLAELHTSEDRHRMTKKLNQIFNEQCHKQEDINVNKTQVSV